MLQNALYLGNLQFPCADLAKWEDTGLLAVESVEIGVVKLQRVVQHCGRIKAGPAAFNLA